MESVREVQEQTETKGAALFAPAPSEELLGTWEGISKPCSTHHLNTTSPLPTVCLPFQYQNRLGVHQKHNQQPSSEK